MKTYRRNLMLALLAAVFLLTGCAAAVAPPPTETAPTDPAPIAVVAEPGDYDVKIYTMDPNTVTDIPDESVPLSSSAVLSTEIEGPLTKRQAEAMAIQYAGLTHEDVLFLFSKEDMEDGIPVFEVSFRSGEYSYEFEIARDTAEILTYEKEYR